MKWIVGTALLLVAAALGYLGHVAVPDPEGIDSR